MKRFSSTNSLVTSLYPPQEKQQQEENCHHSRDFRAMLDGLDIDEVDQNADKKRRLSHNQVKALEKAFEVDNKLDPCKKVALAHELGLQPRQVAIWFQNRRARWKIKQLETDYINLKANYESLRLNYGQLEQNKRSLTTELKELKAKLATENAEKKTSSWSEPQPSNSTNNLAETKPSPNSDYPGLNQEPIRRTFQLLPAPEDLSKPGLEFCFPPQMNSYDELMHSKGVLENADQQQWTEMTEATPFGSVEESCNIYSVDQILTFGW